jgi:hypothetical protein
MNEPVDLFESLDRFPNYNEFWLFADDAFKATQVRPYDARNVRLHLYRSGIAVVRQHAYASDDTEVETCEYIDACVEQARFLKGPGFASTTYGILAAPHIIVMQWDHTQWRAYDGGLVTWLKETLLREVNKRRSAEAKRPEELLAKARNVVKGWTCTASNSHEPSIPVSREELLLLCGLAQQALDIATGDVIDRLGLPALIKDPP